MADIPPYAVTHHYGASPWQWHCQVEIGTGLLDEQCPAWGLDRTEQGAAEKAAQHVATAHPTAPEETDHA